MEKVDGKSGISLKQGKGSFEITVGDEQTRYYSGYFACMIRTEGSDFSYIIPFAASAEDPSLINDMTLSAAKEHALSSEEEWELLADFGFYVSEEGSDRSFYRGILVSIPINTEYKIVSHDACRSDGKPNMVDDTCSRNFHAPFFSRLKLPYAVTVITGFIGTTYPTAT